MSITFGTTRRTLAGLARWTFARRARTTRSSAPGWRYLSRLRECGRSNSSSNPFPTSSPKGFAMTSDTPFVHLTTPCGARFSYLTHLGEEARELDTDTLLQSVSLSVASPCCQRRVKYAEHASGDLLSCV